MKEVQCIKQWILSALPVVLGFCLELGSVLGSGLTGEQSWSVCRAGPTSPLHEGLENSGACVV